MKSLDGQNSTVQKSLQGLSDSLIIFFNFFKKNVRLTYTSGCEINTFLFVEIKFMEGFVMDALFCFEFQIYSKPFLLEFLEK